MIFGVLGWVFVEDKKECAGSKIKTGSFPFVADCAAKCEGISAMFIFGTNDYGRNRCKDQDCDCYCETSASIYGSCNQQSHDGFRLYKYGK